MKNRLRFPADLGTSGTLSTGGGQGQPQSQSKVAGFFR